MRPLSVTPPGRFSSAIILAVLVPTRVGAAFFVWAALRGRLALVGAAGGRRLGWSCGAHVFLRFVAEYQLVGIPWVKKLGGFGN